MLVVAVMGLLVSLGVAWVFMKESRDNLGINLFLADGEAAFQEVFHLHMHIIPRFKGDEFKISADWSVKPPREELDEIAAQIRKTHDGL